MRLPLWKLCYHFLALFAPQKTHFYIVFETDKSYIRLSCSQTIYHNISPPHHVNFADEAESIFSFYSLSFANMVKNQKSLKILKCKKSKQDQVQVPRTKRKSDSPIEHLLNAQYLNFRSKSIQLFPLN